MWHSRHLPPHTTSPIIITTHHQAVFYRGVRIVPVSRACTCSATRSYAMCTTSAIAQCRTRPHPELVATITCTVRYVVLCAPVCVRLAACFWTRATNASQSRSTAAIRPICRRSILVSMPRMASRAQVARRIWTTRQLAVIVYISRRITICTRIEKAPSLRTTCRIQALSQSI